MNMLCVLALLSGLAFGQDSVNAHGFNVSPDDNGAHDLITTWGADRHEDGDAALDLTAEYARDTLELHRFEDGQEVVDPYIQDLFALNASGFLALHDRIGLTLSAPVYLGLDGTGDGQVAGVGDFRVAVPVNLIRPEEDGGLGLSVIPLIDVPGFSTDVNLSATKLSGGGVLAAQYGRDRWRVSANLGGHFSPRIDFFNLTGRERLLASAGASVGLTDNVALRGEAYLNPTLRQNEVRLTDSPGEAILSLRRARKDQSENGLSWTLGGATALTRGASAATWRVFGGVGYAWPAKEAYVPDPGPPDLVYMNFDAVDEDGEFVDVPVLITNGIINLETTTGELVDNPVVFPPGFYSVTYGVDCEDLVVIDGDKLILMEPIYFDFDKDNIRMPDSWKIMTALLKVLEEHDEIVLLEVAGHTDERGSHEYNEDLSQRRMNSVVDWLVERGIERDRLIPRGFGERALLYDNCDTRTDDPTGEDCHQLNRRVEFTILERSEE